MRLLNVHTRKLKRFIGRNRPAYAILSHTWGDDEVEFSDIDTPAWTEKKGHYKIDMTCRQAAQARPQIFWVWIDTICINKDSSAELSEAINSMYAWYRDAVVCYAYLEDVQEHDLSTLSKARWFTRGWTLQELVAPREVEFFGQCWCRLGSKGIRTSDDERFTSTLSEITGIEEMALREPHCVHLQSVATRMSWASDRDTTREEDQVYCLMGLFGVNMPPLYGEGEQAFLRLQEEIIRSSSDHTIFAWDCDPDAVWYSNRDPFATCLAYSPRDFRSSGSIVPLTRKVSVVSPYSVTNFGLQITLPLHATVEKGPNIFYGLLHCYWLGSRT